MSTSTCYRCNRTGHFARVCPQGGGDRGGRGDRDGGNFGRGGGRDKCYKCNRYGHFARDCKEEKDRFFYRGPYIRKYFGSGLISKYKWVSKNFRSIGSMKMGNESVGKCTLKHGDTKAFRSHPETVKIRQVADRRWWQFGIKKMIFGWFRYRSAFCAAARCYHCNEVGHIARDCTQSPSEPSCYNCNKTGHIARNCPEGSSKSCYLCGKQGHISRDCDQANDRRSNR